MKRISHCPLPSGAIHLFYKFYPPACKLSLCNGNTVIQDLLQLKRFHAAFCFSAFQLCHIKHIVDQSHQMARSSLDFIQTILHPLRIPYTAPGNFQHSHNPVNRLTDIVGHIREEFRLGPTGAFGLLQGCHQTAVILILYIDPYKSRNDRCDHNA